MTAPRYYNSHDPEYPYGDMTYDEVYEQYEAECESREEAKRDER